MPYKCLSNRILLCVPLNHTETKVPGLMVIPDPVRIVSFSWFHKYFPFYPIAFLNVFLVSDE